MATAALYNPQTIPYGSQAWTISGSSYVAENISVTRPTVVLDRYDELGAPSGQVFVQDWITGDATLQSTSTTSIPQIGMQFTASLSGSAETFVVSEVGQSFEQRGLRTVRVNFRKVV